MALTKTLISSSILRGLQALFGIIVLGLSMTLIKGHNPENYPSFSSAPKILTCTAGVGGLTLAGALAGFLLAWTEFLRGYFEVVVDIVVLLGNLCGGVLLAIRLRGRNCADASYLNRFGSEGEYPFKDALGNIDILNGGCGKNANDDEVCWYTSHESRFEQLNARCKKSQADLVFMFLTVVVLFGILGLTYMRMTRR